MVDLSPTDDLRRATIMMVDDEPTTIDVIEMFLHGEGYENFISVTDSREAVDTLAREIPDLLMLDLMMPEVGGLEILEAMRQDAALREIPVLILTSATDPEIKLQALELGASDFLAKPVDRSELALRVRNTLAAKAHRDRLTYYDALTGLPNRRLFLDRLRQGLEASTSGDELALLQVGLDRFRQVNDTLGQGFGDALLTQVASRLEKTLVGESAPGGASSGDLVCRAGGDEFLVMLGGHGAGVRSPRLARSLLSSMGEPFQLDGRDIFLSCSIGIALHPNDASDVESLVTNAGAAMTHAKQGGGNQLEFYDASLNAESGERLKIETELRKALEQNELVLYYQPKVSIRTGRIVGCEALMRWIHPELGFVPPDRFIPIAEETGQITALGEWALRQACAQSRAWMEAGYPRIRIAVNVSSRQFRPEQLQHTIRSALTESGIEGQALAIELTEGAIMTNPNETAEMLLELKEMGLRVSIDDFGTGYSSLSYLKRFPIDELKIDKSFVQGVPEDHDDAAIVSAIIRMAHALGLKVVAEGVETDTHLAFLRGLGCDQYQGYYCSPALSPEDWREKFPPPKKKGADPS